MTWLAGIGLLLGFALMVWSWHDVRLPDWTAGLGFLVGAVGGGVFLSQVLS
jgi:hypothetical protein